MKPDIDAYVQVMAEIKRRTDVTFAFLKDPTKAIYKATQVESMVLQVRMITELVAMASLAANREIFERNEKKFAKHWHPDKILKDIEDINPGFYPAPITEVPSGDPRYKNMLVDMTDGFMTRNELVQVHGRCGDVLHAQNPYGKKTNYGEHAALVQQWMERIKNLLNCHKVQLHDNDCFYIVHMKEEQDDKVHMYRFEKTPGVVADATLAGQNLNHPTSGNHKEIQ